MITGHLDLYPIDAITVGDRQRRDLGDISEMAESLQRCGQIHPITIKRTGELIVGERRFRAAQKLGWTHIRIQFIEDLSAEELQVIELEENLRRKSLTWQEEVDATDRYHKQRLSMDPGWTIEKTAEALGVSPQNISRYITVATEIASGNEKVLKADKISVAANLAQRAVARRADNEVKSALALVPAGPHIQPAPAPTQVIQQGSFLNWAPTYTGEKFNFIHCDFPYGIQADNFKQGNAGLVHGTYADSEDLYFQLLECFLTNLDRFCHPSAHIMFWHSWRWHSETKELFKDCGLDIRVDDFPLIWHKTDNAGLLPDPQRGPRRVNEVALMLTRGDRLIVQAVANTYGAPTANDIHMSVKPEPMLRHFFRMFVDDSTSILDPTCGSGSALRAADALGAQRLLGLEINQDYAAAALKQFNQAKALRSL